MINFGDKMEKQIRKDLQKEFKPDRFFIILHAYLSATVPI